MSGNAIPNLQINNSSNITLASNAKIGTNLTFTSGNISLGSDSLIIGNTATVTNPGTTTGFVVTNGTGSLVKDSLVGANIFTFPVGYSTTTYYPVTLANTGVVDNFSVNSIDHVLNNGTTGTAFSKEVVDASWKINEAVAGGSNLSITAGWNSSNELTNFDRTRGGISYYITSPSNNVGWDLTNNLTGAATGSNPYSYTRTGITTLGTFAVGARPVLTTLLISPKIFLQGCYAGGDTMSNKLGKANLIPTTEPYSALGTILADTHRGSGGGETTTSTILANTNHSTDIVDWVLVQLHRASDSVVVSQRAVLLEKNGNIVETDGVSPVNMAGNLPGNYFISIKHRNHLGIRIAGTLVLAKTTSTNYDFTTSLNKVYSKGITNNAMATLATGIYGLWGGNLIAGSTTVKYTGSNNDQTALLNTGLGGSKTTVLNNVYSIYDVNLDGKIRYTGPNNDQNALLSTVLSGNKTTTLNQSAF
ncbi:MAG: hypothetical protein WDM71_06690 [Ferruginibacter sp.]